MNEVTSVAMPPRKTAKKVYHFDERGRRKLLADVIKNRIVSFLRNGRNKEYIFSCTGGPRGVTVRLFSRFPPTSSFHFLTDLQVKDVHDFVERTKHSIRGLSTAVNEIKSIDRKDPKEGLKVLGMRIRFTVEGN